MPQHPPPPRGDRARGVLPAVLPAVLPGAPRRTTALFDGLPPAAAGALDAVLRTVDVPRGGRVFEQGDPDDSLFLVRSGKVKLSRRGRDGRENLLSVNGPADVFGELSVFDPCPRTATATALTDARLSALGAADFRSWLARHPACAEQVLRMLARRVRRTHDALADLVFTDVPGRVAKALLGLAERFGTAEPDGVRVPHDLTQDELAQLVGASRETVNKALADFTARGWLVVMPRTVVVLDAERLARRAR